MISVSHSEQAILSENGCELKAAENGSITSETKNGLPAVFSKTDSFEGSVSKATTSSCGPKNVELIYASQQQAIKASFGHNEVGLELNRNVLNFFFFFCGCSSDLERAADYDFVTCSVCKTCRLVQELFFISVIVFPSQLPNMD